MSHVNEIQRLLPWVSLTTLVFLIPTPRLSCVFTLLIDHVTNMTRPTDIKENHIVWSCAIYISGRSKPQMYHRHRLSIRYLRWNSLGCLRYDSSIRYQNKLPLMTSTTQAIPIPKLAYLGCHRHYSRIPYQMNYVGCSKSKVPYLLSFFKQHWNKLPMGECSGGLHNHAVKIWSLLMFLIML